MGSMRRGNSKEESQIKNKESQKLKKKET